MCTEVGLHYMCGIQLGYKVNDTLPQHSSELLCIEVIPNHAKPFLVVSWYDSMADKFQDLENVISYLETFQKEIIFLIVIFWKQIRVLQDLLNICPVFTTPLFWV